MKFSAALALVVIVGFVANGSALPAKNRMVYLQQPQWYGAPQRMMYVQYVQPSSSRTHARSTQAAAALVAGESVATGTYLKDCDHSEADIAVAGPGVGGLEAEQQQGQQGQHGEDVLGAGGAHVAQSVAEAYPEDRDVQADAQVVEDAVEGSGEGVTLEGAIEQAAENTNTKAPRGYNFGTDDSDANVEAQADAEAPVEASAAAPAVNVNADLPATEPVAPVAAVKPARRYLPAHKKVYVELEQSAENVAEQAEAEEEDAGESTADEDEDDGSFTGPVAPVNPVRVPNAHRPTKKASVKPAKPSKAAQNTGAAKPSRAEKPLPVGTFFPTDFGGATGGAIAIANSFSTGEGGSATSHAIAYGAPEPSRARVRPSKLH